MSILIKGMEMPKHSVVVVIEPDGTVSDYRYGTYVGSAVPVPPHGRLIDKDTLEDVVMRLNWTERDMRITRGEFKLIDAVLFEFPTIIEAEEG